MTTPVKPSSQVPVHRAEPTRPQPVEPVSGPLGWFLVLAAGIVLIASTWLFYNDDQELASGYRGGMLGTVLVLAALWLRSTLPKLPALAVIGLTGLFLLLSGGLGDHETYVTVSEMATGGIALVGLALCTAGTYRR